MNLCTRSRFLYLASTMLTLLVFVVTTTSTPIVRRSAEFSTKVAIPADASEQEIYDAKYKIWVEMLNHALDYRMSMVCRTIIRSSKTEGGPKEGCDKVLQHKSILGYACSKEDIEIFEGVACGFDNIVVPTLPPPSTSAPQPQPQSSPSSAATSSGSSTSSSSSSTSSSTSRKPTTSDSSSTSTTKQTTDAPSTKPMVSENTTKAELPVSEPMIKPVLTRTELPGEATQENATSPDSVDEKDEKLSTSAHIEDTSTTGKNVLKHNAIITHDSRLSATCNILLDALAKSHSETADDTEIQSNCHKLNLLAQDQAARDKDSANTAGLLHEDALRAACTEEELPLLHDTLCAGHAGKPTHALQGQQQKRVNYVIKTELTSSCRSALSPLGENEMREDVEDSCLTLKGAQGEELVSNHLCTRGDLDNLLKVVCDSAPGVLSPDYRTFFLVSLSVLVTLFGAFV